MAKGRKTGGRQPGSRNKSTADIKALAQEHTPRAITVLADIMERSESDPARVAAIKELLERGHGKSPMAAEDKETLENLGGVLAEAWSRLRRTNAA